MIPWVAYICMHISKPLNYLSMEYKCHQDSVIKSTNYEQHERKNADTEMQVLSFIDFNSYICFAVHTQIDT